MRSDIQDTQSLENIFVQSRVGLHTVVLEDLNFWYFSFTDLVSQTQYSGSIITVIESEGKAQDIHVRLPLEKQ